MTSAGHLYSVSDDDDNDPDYAEEYTVRRLRKRRKLRDQHGNTGVRPVQKPPEVSAESLFAPMVAVLEDDVHVLEEGEISFEQYIEPLLVDYSRAVVDAQTNFASLDTPSDQSTYPISRMQAKRILDEVLSSSNGRQMGPTTSIVYRKLKVEPSPLRSFILSKAFEKPPDRPLTPLPVLHKAPPVNPDVLDALYGIRSTPYANSFLSRLLGFQPDRRTGVISCDWETRAPWIELMNDVKEHYALMYPDAEKPTKVDAPIIYSSLHPDHLRQVHELLNSAFWSGIDVTDSLQYMPEKCTIVATYKKLVVGAAFLSSPQETYITYLAVKPGFDNTQIATSMLYHLISLNPHRDITLHVSTTNPAMLLYNRFGFKAEEFIVGFYEDYVESQTRGSKNAFRLRLRQ